MPSNGGSCGPPGRLGLADGPDSPRPVARADPACRVDVDGLAVDLELPAPRTHLGEALSIEGYAVACPQDVPLLLDNVEQAFKRQISCNAFGFVKLDTQLVERFDDVEAVVADMLIESVLIDGVGQVHRGLGVTASAESAAVAAGNEEESVLHAEIRVVAEPGDDEDVPGAVVRVVIAPVVEVAVRGPGPGNGLGYLVYRVLIHRSEHQSASPISLLSSDA